MLWVSVLDGFLALCLRAMKPLQLYTFPTFGQKSFDLLCAKVASANVETVFSGAGRISAKSRTLDAELLSDYAFLHYNYKYDWLRPTLDEIVAAYKKLYGKEQRESYGESDGESEEEEAEDEEAGEEDAEPDVCDDCSV